jgi:hypothetical protein
VLLAEVVFREAEVVLLEAVVITEVAMEIELAVVEAVKLS